MERGGDGVGEKGKGGRGEGGRRASALEQTHILQSLELRGIEVVQRIRSGIADDLPHAAAVHGARSFNHVALGPSVATVGGEIVILAVAKKDGV